MEGAASGFLRILIRAWAVVSESNVTTTTIPARYAARGFSVGHATYFHRPVILWPWTIISCRVCGRVAMATIAIVEAAATFTIGMAALWVWHSRGWAFVRVTTASRAFLNYNQKGRQLSKQFFFYSPLPPKLERNKNGFTILIIFFCLQNNKAYARTTSTTVRTVRPSP